MRFKNLLVNWPPASSAQFGRLLTTGSQEVKLNPEQESVLRGESGQALALAMKTLVAYGRAFAAERLVPISSSHLAGTSGILTYRAYQRLLGRLVNEGVKVRVKTTTNPRPGYALSARNRLVFARQKPLERMLEALGATPNYSCVCYDHANLPAFGDRLGWAESSAVQYANSVIGARTNRNSIMIDICCAVTGFAPEFGYLLDEHRRGELLVKLDIGKMDASGLGFLIGQKAVDQVPVIEHHDFNRIELKNMGGAMAASGGVAMFHVEGLTPEAPDLKAAFDGEPVSEITITQEDLDALRTRDPEGVDMVVFGCPQMTYPEATELAARFSGKTVKRPTWFCLVPQALERFRKSDLYETVRSAGVEVNEYCPLAALTMQLGRKRILTSSGKLFYYLDGTAYGTEEDCLRASGIIG